MRGSFFCSVTIAVLLILWFEWRNLKQKPKKDRVVFLTLIILVWFLSMLNLPNTPGPISFLQVIFKPFKGLIEQ